MPRHGRHSLHVAGFAAGIAFFWAALYVYVPILAVHTRALGASDTMVGLVVGSYGLTQLILRIPLGVVSDRLGRRKVFVLAGFVTIAVSSAVLALASSPSQMFAGRALAGVAASSWVASTVLFSSFYPAGQAVRATSIMSFTASFGQMVATLAGGYIAYRYGLAAPYWVSVVVAAVGLAAISATPEETRATLQPPTLRQILAVLTLPSLLLVSLAAAIVQYSAFSTSFAFVPIYASEVLRADAAQLGILTSVTMVPYVLMTTFVAWLSLRVREHWLISLGMLLLAASTAATLSTRSFEALVAARAVFGIGQGLTYPVLMGLSIKSVPQHQRASAMGGFQAIYALGMTAGPALSGLVADSFGLSWVFVSTAVLCLLGIVPALAGATRSARPVGEMQNPAR